MPYSHAIVERIRELLPYAPTKRMFGGIVFFVRGYIVVGVFGDRMMARVGVDRANELLQQSGITHFAKTPARMPGYIQAEESYIDTDDALEALIDDAMAWNARL